MREKSPLYSDSSGPLRRLADLEDAVHRAEIYLAGLEAQPPVSPARMGVSLAWSWGRSAPGYDELVGQMQEVAEERWQEMADEALRRLRVRRDALRREVFGR